MARKKVKTEKNVLKSVSLRASLVQTIENKAKENDRTAHYLMVQAIEEKFKTNIDDTQTNTNESVTI